MNKTEMMAKIANAKTERENAQIAKAKEFENKVTYYRTKIKTLAPRIKDLLEVARELQRNGFDLGENDAPSHSFSKMPEFETNWWDHRLGFFCENRQYRPVRRTLAFGIGFMGGGAAGPDFLVDEEGELHADFKHYTTFPNCKDILDTLDDFEKGFYAYVESL